MPLAVQLDVDEETEAALGALSERLEKIPGLETVRQIGDVHHLSLGIYDDVVAGAVASKLERYAERLGPVEVRLAYIGLFPGGVLFAGPVVTRELLRLHRDFHEAFGCIAGACWEHYRPGFWVPHVTLTMNIRSAALKRAVAEVMAHWKPGCARLTALRMIEFRPARSLVLLRL